MVRQYVDEGLELLEARFHLIVIVVRLVEEILPLVQLLVELGSTLRHKFEALRLELVQGHFVNLVHHLDIVDNPDFGWNARRPGQELAMRHAWITGKWLIVFTIIRLVPIRLAITLQFSITCRMVFNLERRGVVQWPDTDLAAAFQWLRYRWCSCRRRWCHVCHVLSRWCLLFGGCLPRRLSGIGHCCVVVIRRMPGRSLRQSLLHSRVCAADHASGRLLRLLWCSIFGHARRTGSVPLGCYSRRDQCLRIVSFCCEEVVYVSLHLCLFLVIYVFQLLLWY